MSDEPSSRPHRTPKRLPYAPLVFLVSLVVLAATVLVLGVLAVEGDTVPLRNHRSYANNGTVILAYLVPPYAPHEAHLEVAYTFQGRTGDVFVVDCVQLERLFQGLEPERVAVHREDVSSGHLSLPMENYLGYGWWMFDSPGAAGDNGSGATGGSPVSGVSDGDVHRPAFCGGVFVAFRWSGSDSKDHPPEHSVQVRETPLDTVEGSALLLLAAAAGVTTLAAGLLWRRPSQHPSVFEGAGTAELLYRLADRSVAWLTRTRRYLLLSGAVGIFLWYPLLVPWAWRIGRDASGAEWLPWTLVAGVLLLLVGLTWLWTREFLRLDRELGAWRRQVMELRRREEALLKELAP